MSSVQWGLNALRIRATYEPALPAENWALSEPLPELKDISVSIHDDEGFISNGAIAAQINKRGKITISNSKGKVLLEEFMRQRRDVKDPKCSALRIVPREFKPRLGSDSWHLTARFEASHADEKIFGMGQYQQPYLDLKGADVELAQRNSQALSHSPSAPRDTGSFGIIRPSDVLSSVRMSPPLRHSQPAC